jgi:hypothetical protein
MTGVLLLAAPPAQSLPEQRQRVISRSVLVAGSFETMSGGHLRAEHSAAWWIGTSKETQTEPRSESVLIRLRPATLADSIDELAGRRVKILNARVVGVFEPRAFLIESATRDDVALGFRNRLLVIVEAATLRVSQELLVGSTVVIVGVARTLLGVRVSPELPWPSKLTPELIESLEVRAAVAATSVRTPEGIELTERAPGGWERPR